jgi:hypothetical protein
MRVIVRLQRTSAPNCRCSRNDGWRYTAFTTNTATGSLQCFEVRHRAHARVEDRIRGAKDTGLRRLRSREFAINAAWCTAAAIAADLIAWLRLLTLDGELAVPNETTAQPRTARLRPPGPRPNRSRAAFDRNPASPHPADQLSPRPDDQRTAGDHAHRRDSRRAPGRLRLPVGRTSYGPGSGPARPRGTSPGT